MVPGGTVLPPQNIFPPPLNRQRRSKLLANAFHTAQVEPARTQRRSSNTYERYIRVTNRLDWISGGSQSADLGFRRYDWVEVWLHDEAASLVEQFNLDGVCV